MASKSSTKLALFTVLLLLFTIVATSGRVEPEAIEEVLVGDEGAMATIELLVLQHQQNDRCTYYRCHSDSHCKKFYCSRCSSDIVGRGVCMT
ncbi:hypothetical protein A4A49_15790 [Nicotiana attenuata]|uniref:Carboxypeptidase A inhibitor-like domain-containing protein n=1 Tax=Nicotiana attenuata TaxID=49451 RepID=A0A314L757_NICAT|nr:hypothetical protein A4A49_15790 [Nicotiana attenuata]